MIFMYYNNIPSVRGVIKKHCYCIPQKFDLTRKQIEAVEDRASQQVRNLLHVQYFMYNNVCISEMPSTMWRTRI